MYNKKKMPKLYFIARQNLYMDCHGLALQWTQWGCDLYCQACFVFLPQKFCGNPARVSRENFVI